MVEAIKEKLWKWYTTLLRRSPLVRRVSLMGLNLVIRIVGRERATRWTLLQTRNSFTSRANKFR